MRFFLSVILLFFAINAHSQFRGNNWVFGDSIHITFNGSAPPLITQLNSDFGEPYSAISNTSGSLVFYAGSRMSGDIYSTYLYDMFGSFLINSSSTHGDWSATQGSIILPNPNDLRLFYLFAISRNASTLVSQLYYNVINDSLNGGLGEVVQKNVLLCDSMLCEMMTAVKHANGRDWWLVLHQRFSSNYLVYFISPDGILGPYIQTIGLTINNAIIGQGVFSYDGERMAHSMSDGQLQLLDFDRCTGIFSNCVQLGDSIYNNKGNYGCSFSRNATKLYVSDLTDSLFQYNLLAPNVKASRALIYSMQDTVYAFGQHQIAENDKIYLTAVNTYSNSIDPIVTSLSVINSPDSLNINCNFQPFSFSTDGKKVYWGLPNIPNYALGPVTGSICDSLTATVKEIKRENDFQIYPNPADDYFTIRNSTAQQADIMVTDVNGNEVIENFMNSSNKTFHIEEFPAGIYIVNIQTNATHYALKLVRINSD